MIEHATVDVGEVRLHVASQGTGKPVLFLHGFPELWVAWRHQMQTVAEAGWRAVAPDQRGYNLSDKPSGTRAYRIDALVADVVGLIAANGGGPIPVVAHDWGVMVAFCLAERHPELVERLVILNGPHPELYRSAMRHFDQISRAWYVFLFLLPLLPVWLIRRRFVLERMLRGGAVHPSSFTDEDMDEYVCAMRRPGAARAAVSWYRAAFRYPVRAPGTIHAPTLVLWGEQDVALSPRLLDGLDRYVPDLRIERLPHASHWVEHDAAREVGDAIVAFLSP